VIEVLEHGYASEASDMALAKEVAETLNRLYPHHPWLVGFQGGNVIVRHMAIDDVVHQAVGMRGFAYAIDPKDLQTPSAITHAAMSAGGQLLEAFGLPRGPWDGRDPVCPPWDETTPHKPKAWH